MVRSVPGILCTDSKGGYDAVMINESPLLGLSNLRSALQAMQLRENMIRVNTKLRWVASDYDLGDSMTKKRPDSRVGLMKFMKTRLWCVAYDPSFTSAKKSHQRGQSAIRTISEPRAQSESMFWVGAATKSSKSHHISVLKPLVTWGYCSFRIPIRLCLSSEVSVTAIPAQEGAPLRPALCHAELLRRVRGAWKTIAAALAALVLCTSL